MGRLGRPRIEAGLLAIFVLLVLVGSKQPRYTPFVLWVVVPAMAAGSLAYSRFRIAIVPEFWLRIAFVVFGVAGAFYAQEPDLVLRQLRALAGSTVIWIPLLVFIGMRGRIRAFLVGVFLSASILCLRAIIQTHSGPWDPSSVRMSGDLANPNQLAFIFLYGIMSAVYLLSRIRAWTLRILLFFGSGFLAFGILATGSRKTLVAGLVFAVLYSAWRRTKIQSAMAVIALCFLGLLSSGPLINYLQDETIVGRRMEAAQFERGVGRREALLRDAFSAFAEHPIVGVGLGNVVVHSATGGEAHNDIAEVLASTGVIGFGLYLAVYISFAGRIWRLSRHDYFGKGLYKEVVFLRAVFVTFLILGLGMPLFFTLEGMILMGALIFRSFFLERNVASIPDRSTTLNPGPLTGSRNYP